MGNDHPTRGVIGIDLGGTKCHGAVADESGVILAEVRRSTGEAGNTVAAVWDSLAASATAVGLPITQTVLGVPAVIDRQTQVLSRGPNVGWDSLGAKNVLEGRGPVSIQNDANLAAFAELTVGAMQQTSDFVLFSLGTGFGGAVVANGRVVEGHRGGAAEFGDLRMGSSASGPGVMDRRLEDVASGTGIGGAAERLAAALAPAVLPFEASSRGVLSAAARGDSAARVILDPVLEALATLIATVGCVLDPAAIVFDGSVGRALAPFLQKIRDLAAERADSVPLLVSSQLEPNSTVRGALEMAASLTRRTTDN